jgi:hypothetical protein
MSCELEDAEATEAKARTKSEPRAREWIIE